MIRLRSCPPTVRLGTGLWLLLALPPLRQALEETMSRQMLVQIPLLALAGWWLAPLVPHAVRARLLPWNRQGISGLLLVAFTAMLWMIPRTIDMALESSAVELSKFVLVPLGIGTVLALSWPQAGFVVRGIFLVESVATAFRAGWLYEVSPERLCSNYLLGDQQTLGRVLLVIGAVASLWLVIMLIWGRLDVEPAPGA